MVQLSAYELERERNIARNRELLEKLGLDKPAFEKKEQPRKKAPQQKKRKAEVVEADDSGAESSYVTSGAESIRTSETSYSESSSVRRSKGRRPFMLGVGDSIYRAAVGKRIPPPNSLAPDSALPDVPSKRASVGSGSLSASSSTSSLLPPSPSMTVSSLSAIPESPPSSYRTSSDQEDRRAIRAAHRMSGSSMASSSTAASSAYAANMKRSRPPSIAQVLENSPNMDDVLEKLRPFQPSS
ncbi:hypothetical protein NMY22_g15976 [Coprinellus aureogranulatus]|nr:hypothetical protein NMY22_g15976 [Coprinellus aureogranulatus]